jgi:hypothetical protein
MSRIDWHFRIILAKTRLKVSRILVPRTKPANVFWLFVLPVVRASQETEVLTSNSLIKGALAANYTIDSTRGK